jgi:hypothetical protein
MKRHQKKKVNMKIRILLVTISAAALAATTFNVNAGTTLLSPRDAGNQIKAVPGGTTAQPAQLAQADQSALSPRAAASQIPAVNGTETVAAKCSVTGSPKHVATVGSAARTTCCKSTLAECPTMSTCGSAK